MLVQYVGDLRPATLLYPLDDPPAIGGVDLNCHAALILRIDSCACVDEPLDDCRCARVTQRCIAIVGPPFVDENTGVDQAAKLGPFTFADFDR
ncbi:MAG: hypothetical protein R3E68_13125 [Burkholderiaceae bacterium]